MSANYDLIGWPLLPVPNERGEIEWPSLERSIRESIQVILRTRPGEQLMRPRFGAGLEEFLHAPNTLTTRRAIRDRIQDTLTQWETRILLDRVDVSEGEQPSQVRVTIAYRLARTGQAQRVGVTLDLEA